MTEFYNSFDFSRACLEGWCIFECDGSENGFYQLCRIDSQDEPDGVQLNDDCEAWWIVVNEAQNGSRYHQDVLDMLVELNPIEREVIRKVTGY